MQFTINIPDHLIPELQAIATSAGFNNPKEMFTAYLKHTIKGYRASQISSLTAIRIAKEEAQVDAEAIE